MASPPPGLEPLGDGCKVLFKLAESPRWRFELLARLNELQGINQNDYRRIVCLDKDGNEHEVGYDGETTSLLLKKDNFGVTIVLKDSVDSVARLRKPTDVGEPNGDKQHVERMAPADGIHRSQESSHQPPLRDYMQQSILELWGGQIAAAAAAEAVCFAVAGSGAWFWYLPMAGGTSASSALYALLSLDKLTKPSPRLGWNKRMAFLFASGAVGVAMSPMSVVFAATIGDPKSRGNGPAALGALATIFMVGQCTALEALPDSWLEGAETSEDKQAGCAGAAALSTCIGGAAALSACIGGLAAAGLGLVFAHSFGRPGAKRTVLTASLVFAVHGCLTAALANWYHSHGKTEPLRPVLAPVRTLLAPILG